MATLYYRIADLDISIDSNLLNPFNLFNYAPFRVQEDEVTALLFSVRFGEVNPSTKGEMKRSYCIEGMTLFLYVDVDGGCDVVCKSKYTDKIYYLSARDRWTDIIMNLTFEDEEEYAILNNFLMLSFIYSASFHNTVLIHSSCIKYNNCGVAFLGHSGVGKSTHSRLWLENIEGASLLNDDQPAVRMIEGIPYLYGTPWSGKTHCYKRDKVRLVSLFLMEQAAENEIIPLSPMDGFRKLLASCSMMQEERTTFNCIVQTLIAIAESTQISLLRNRPEREAAEMARTYMSYRAM